VFINLHFPPLPSLNALVLAYKHQFHLCWSLSSFGNLCSYFRFTTGILDELICPICLSKVRGESVSVLGPSERCLLYIYSKTMLLKLYTALESFLILPPDQRLFPLVHYYSAINMNSAHIQMLVLFFKFIC